MVKKYIKGNKERGFEVIAELEKLGGINKHEFAGDGRDSIYFIGSENIISIEGSLTEIGKIIMECFEEIKLPGKKPKPKLKVIRGVEGRGEEVIKLLKSMGGENTACQSGTRSDGYYFIADDRIIGFEVSYHRFFNDYELEILELPEKKPILKVIRGNIKRGREVIELLENLGGKNITVGCDGKNNEFYYYVNCNNYISYRTCDDSFFNNYELEILELPNEFRPFDKVLVRNNVSEDWKPELYYKYDNNNELYETTTNRCYKQCIPYEGNEYLLETVSKKKLCNYAKDKISESTDTPDTSVDGYVDLGLTSGTLWADRNVGAEAIEYYGKYFTFEEAQKQGNVPTEEQFLELIDECKWTWEGTGYRVVGKNGNFIYLPAAGHDNGLYVNRIGSYGYYWSSSANNNYANYMHLSNDYVFTCDNYCNYRLSVRLVNKEEKFIYNE